MSLDPQSKKILTHSAIYIAEIIQRLEKAFTDPRTLDILEIAVSLIEDQVNYNIKYQPIADYDEISEEDFREDEIETVKLDLTDLSDDAVSSEELREWWNLPFNGEEDEHR